MSWLNLMGFLGRHWVAVLLGVALAAIVANTIAIDADRDAQRTLAKERGMILDQSVAAASVVNGWPDTKRLRVEQLPAQIQLYGKAFDQVRTAAATAKADDLQFARDVETRAARIAQEQTHDINAKLVEARRLAADRARALRLRAEREGRAAAADRGGGGDADLSAPANATRDPAGAGAAAELDEDLEIAAENTVKAEGWREYWLKLFGEDR